MWENGRSPPRAKRVPRHNWYGHEVLQSGLSSWDVSVQSLKPYAAGCAQVRTPQQQRLQLWPPIRVERVQVNARIVYGGCVRGLYHRVQGQPEHAAAPKACAVLLHVQR